MPSRFRHFVTIVVVWSALVVCARAQPSFTFPVFPTPSLPALKLPEQVREALRRHCRDVPGLLPPGLVFR